MKEGFSKTFYLLLLSGKSFKKFILNYFCLVNHLIGVYDFWPLGFKSTTASEEIVLASGVQVMGLTRVFFGLQ
jgi:hypothetical protein